MFTIGQQDAELDQATLLAAADGDAAAIDSVVCRFHGELTGFARRRGAEDPEGMVHLALTSTLARLSDLRTLDDATVRAYLYRVVRRSLARERKVTERRPTAIPDGGYDSPDDRVDWFQQVGDKIDVDRLLDQLTERDRELMVRRFLLDQRHEDIANDLGLAPEAVRQASRRALGRLRLLAAAAAAVALFVLLVNGLTGAAPSGVDTRPATENQVPVPDQVPTSAPEADAIRADDAPAPAPEVSVGPTTSSPVPITGDPQGSTTASAQGATTTDPRPATTTTQATTSTTSRPATTTTQATTSTTIRPTTTTTTPIVTLADVPTTRTNAEGTCAYTVTNNAAEGVWIVEYYGRGVNLLGVLNPGQTRGYTMGVEFIPETHPLWIEDDRFGAGTILQEFRGPCGSGVHLHRLTGLTTSGDGRPRRTAASPLPQPAGDESCLRTGWCQAEFGQDRAASGQRGVVAGRGGSGLDTDRPVEPLAASVEDPSAGGDEGDDPAAGVDVELVGAIAVGGGRTDVGAPGAVTIGGEEVDGDTRHRSAVRRSNRSRDRTCCGLVGQCGIEAADDLPVRRTARPVEPPGAVGERLPAGGR